VSRLNDPTCAPHGIPGYCMKCAKASAAPDTRDARILELEADVRRLEHIHHYHRCPCGARVPENAPCPYCAVRELTATVERAKRLISKTSHILDGVLDEMAHLEKEMP
jgi:hypothetical protein